MAKSERFELMRDRKGVTWDVLMYIPTVSGLGIGAFIFSYAAIESKYNPWNLIVALLFPRNG